MDTLLSRITIDPSVCHGKPCIRGLRYPVETLLELLSSGMTTDEILGDYEDLERDDLLAALAFAARQGSVEERLDLVFCLWDQLVEDGWQPEPIEELITELDRRLAANEADPINIRTWEQVLERVRKPRRRRGDGAG
jgi:putative addiction module component (TIGR02574 family)